MAITSASNKSRTARYGNTQIRYCITFVIITSIVLLFLNFYCSQTTEQIFMQSKKSIMLEKCIMCAQELSELEVLNRENIALNLAQIDALTNNRVIVTDHSGMILYDTNTPLPDAQTYAMLPEITQALTGYDTFSWSYRDGITRSKTAAPVYSYGKLTGCIYLSELDAAQGGLMGSLRRNILTVTIILEIIVIIISLLTALVFSGKLRHIRASMQIIREGDYSHKVKLRGNDELNMLADEFNLLTDRLLTSENKRRQFVSDASHELKTPLASIKLLTDSILQNDMDRDTVHEFVGDIGNEAERLNRMSQKLLSLSRIETQEDGDCEIVYLKPTLDRVTRMLSGIAGSGNIDLVCNIVEDSPILILEDDLYQIAFNLAENGIKYNTPGGTLRIALHREADNAVLRISDTGMGIPEDSLPHIFERFYRVDKARSRKSGGSGLGLAIVKNLVERNGGTISVTSRPGEGTEFTVEFPIFDIEEEEK